MFQKDKKKMYNFVPPKKTEGTVYCSNRSKKLGILSKSVSFSVTSVVKNMSTHKNDIKGSVGRNLLNVSSSKGYLNLN